MELGRLEEESTASLCRRFADQSRTGCLHLQGEVEGATPEADIYLREGRIYTATAPGGSARLGDRLVGGGDLSPEQLQVALELAAEQAPTGRLADVLVTSGMVSRERLRTVVREQIIDCVAVALAWTRGTWRFAEGAVTTQDTPLGLGVQDTLMEAARRLGQIEVIQAHLGSMDTVVDFARTGGEAKLSLTADEWAMLTHIDGLTSVADIAAQAGYTQLEAARIVHGLLAAGVVVRPGEATDAPAPAQDSGTPGARADDLPASPADAVDGAEEDHLARLEGLVQGRTVPGAAAPPAGASPAGGPAAPPPGAQGPADAPTRRRLRDRFKRQA